MRLVPLVALLAGCAGPTWGTWMFTKEVTLATGAECIDDVIHNVVGAFEQIEVGDDPSWTEEDTGTLSAEVFFGRIEETTDGAVLLIGEDALPGTVQNDGSWLFYWTNASSGAESQDHVSGYTFDHTYESTATLRVQGELAKGAFSGTWESETSDVDAWVESDTWSEEAAAIVGQNGEIPVGEHLRRIDTGGTEGPANNSQLDFDCGEAGCTLTVSASCAYRYTLTGVATELEPDDAGWVEDAGQPAGN